VTESLKNPSGQGYATGIGQSDEQYAVMRSWLEFADVGKVEVLSDEEAPFCLCSCPYVWIVTASQSFLPHIVHIMA
jgi:hypothetical protein